MLDQEVRYWEKRSTTSGVRIYKKYLMNPKFKNGTTYKLKNRYTFQLSLVTLKFQKKI